MILITGMGKRPDICQDCYMKGYQDAVSYIENQSREFRNHLKMGLENQLAWCAIVIVGITLWGSELGEWIRTRIKTWLNLSIEVQVAISLVVYGLIITAIIIACLKTVGVSERMVMPVLILLSASLIPFVRYVRSLGQSNVTELKINLIKIKQCVLMCLVILILYRVLSDNGFLGIRIGG